MPAGEVEVREIDGGQVMLGGSATGTGVAVGVGVGVGVGAAGRVQLAAATITRRIEAVPATKWRTDGREARALIRTTACYLTVSRSCQKRAVAPRHAAFSGGGLAAVKSKRVV